MKQLKLIEISHGPHIRNVDNFLLKSLIFSCTILYRLFPTAAFSLPLKPTVNRGFTYLVFKLSK